MKKWISGVEEERDSMRLEKRKPGRREVKRRRRVWGRRWKWSNGGVWTGNRSGGVDRGVEWVRVAEWRNG